MTTTYVTVAIPYVNAEPHLGYAYELVLADIHARAARLLTAEPRLPPPEPLIARIAAADHQP